MNKNHLAIISLLISLVALLVGGYAIFKKPIPVGAPSNLSELAFDSPNSDATVKEGIVLFNLPIGTEQVVKANPTLSGGSVPRDIVVTSMTLVKQGTTTSSYVIDVGTTTAISTKLDTRNYLIDFGLAYAKPTTTAPLLFHTSISTSTNPDTVAIPSGISASTTPLVWKVNDSLAIAITPEGYNNGCGGSHANNIPCQTATSSYRGVSLSLIVRYIATSTYSNP